MRKQIILREKNVKYKCCADNKFLEHSGAHAIGYFDCVGFGFLRSEHVQLRARISVSAKEMRKSYQRNADEIRMYVYQKADAKNQMLKNVKMIYQVTNIQTKS